MFSPPFPSAKYADDTKKRTRVTPAQLTILENTFAMTVTPDSKLRKQLADRLKMPERSIQIWFQNRRAKVKMLQKRALQQQQPWPSQLKTPVGRAWSTDGATQLLGDPLSAYITPSPQPSLLQKPCLAPPLDPCQGWFTLNSLTIGSWHRMKIQPQDLECTYQLTHRSFAWHIRDNEYHFKMVVNFDSLALIELVSLLDPVSAQINLQLLEPPMFFMKSHSDWVQCSDFTEGMQASLTLTHSLRGLALDLRQQLLTLIGIDEGLCSIARFPVENNFTDSWRHSSLPIKDAPTWSLPDAY